jgi:hypothetical protein
MSEKPEPTMWIGLKDCGCPVAACVERFDTPPEDTASTKREFIESGLSVLHVSWDVWTEKYMPNFVRNCPHGKKPKLSIQASSEAAK